MSSHSERGAALISVMLVFAIMTILATQMIIRSQSDIERTHWLVTESQAYQYALGGEALARQILWQQQTELNKKAVSSSPIPQLLPVYQPDHGSMAVEIIDLQGRINLNNIGASATYHAPVRRLFTDWLLQPQLAAVLADWVDTDTTPQAGGGEDFLYQSMEVPYRTGNRNLAGSSELMALANMPAVDFPEIQPYLATLAKATAININTAPSEVFSLLNPTLSGQQVLSAREGKPFGFESIAEFQADNATAGLTIDSTLITVTSSYYGVKIVATVNDRKVWLFSRLALDNSNGKITLQQRTIGEQFDVKVQENSDQDQDDNTHHLL